MTTTAMAAATTGACLALAALLIIAALMRNTPELRVAAPAAPWRQFLRRAVTAMGDPSRSQAEQRRRTLGWIAAGVTVWAVSGWPTAGVAVTVMGLWLPWLLGSNRIVREKIARLEALESWCRRMADTLIGGGAIGLAQAITTTAARVEDPIGDAVRALAHRVRTDQGDHADALRELADAVDDRTGDAVAAALLLALHQQSSGIAHVLRQLADGVARDIRARRDIEAARAESRQSIRMLLIIQAGLLVALAVIPTFAAPYGTPTGQVVMAMLLAATAGLLVWMRRLSLGPAPTRFIGTGVS